ncbi:MAG: HD domain-containing protein, partial [Firmicutes bacterium]|nr:HD domain-containing protein [Bacillota bacterium]
MPKIEANLLSTVAGFSRAGDLNDLKFLYHAERVSYTSWRLGLKLGLSEACLQELILSALLHDIGITTTAEKLQLADLEPEEGFASLHCRRGFQLLKETELFGLYAFNVLEHHNRYSPTLGIIPAVIHLADRLDHLLRRDRYYLWQVDDILDYFRSRQGNLFDPDVVGALNQLAAVPGFWLDLQHGNHRRALREQSGFCRLLSIAELEEIAKLMAAIVDSKSSFTADHSQGVARTAAFLGKKLKMPQGKIRLLKTAGLLHDIGKLAVPDEIIMHPGRLNEKQRAIMKEHVYHSYHLIGTIGPGAKPLQR